MSGADIALLVLWTSLAADVTRRPTARSTPLVAGRTGPGVGAKACAGILTVSAIVALEWLRGPLPSSPIRTSLGLSLVLAGRVLHRVARRTIGPWWDAAIVIREGQPIVRAGPYAHVRHPLYLAVLTMAAGTLLTHTSLAIACAALGLAAGTLLKIRREDALLLSVFGPDYAAYAAAVPALLPRLSRGKR